MKAKCEECGHDKHITWCPEYFCGCYAEECCDGSNPNCDCKLESAFHTWADDGGRGGE